MEGLTAQTVSLTTLIQAAANWSGAAGTHQKKEVPTAHKDGYIISAADEERE